MKLLIVDDEEHVREGVELALDWESYQIDQIFMAENGLEALEIVRKHQPEIIICDMSMHIMDGPQFLEKLREEGWTSKVIVLSGYQQFDYARATLLANGIDYLLKPFKIQDLARAIQKAYTQIQEEQQKRLQELSANVHINEANHLAKEQRFASLIEEDNPSIEALESFITSISLDANSFYCATFLPRNKDEVVRRYYERDEQLFNFSLQNITKDIISPIGTWYLLQYETFIVLMLSSSKSSYDVQQKVNQLQEAWKRTIHLATIAGFYAQTITVSKLQQALVDEKSTILNSNIFDNNKHESNTEFLHSIIDKERVIMEAVRSKNIQQIKDIIRSFLEGLTAKQFVSLRELQHYTVEINLLLMRVYAQLKVDRLHETMPLWISQLNEWEAKLIQIFSEMMEVIDYSKVDLGQAQSMSAVRNYIHDQMKEELTLASLADRFHFSPQYLAKRFKEEYGTTIMHYLTQLRMDKASSLLTHTDLSIQEIATECGFEELNYFGKVFRKHFNLSPTNFRKKYKL